MAITTADLKRSILARDAEISRLRRILGDVEAKADLAASAMDEDERGQNIASAFRRISEFVRKSAVDPKCNKDELAFTKADMEDERNAALDRFLASIP